MGIKSLFGEFLHFDSLIPLPGIYPKELQSFNFSAPNYRTPIIALGPLLGKL